MSKKLLLAGETWFSYGVHLKGFSPYWTGSYEEGQREFVAALESRGWSVKHLPNHLATEHFPWTLEELSEFDVVVLSDISADTIQLHPRSFYRGERTPDRLALLADWVRGGGGLVMMGGYMAFSGFEGRGRFALTPLRDVLPVTMMVGDDRIEAPAGVTPELAQNHEILNGISGPWPHFLGYNRIIAREGSDVVLRVGDDPFLVVGDVGKGRSAAFASDCSPHWGSPEFLKWEHYAEFWDRLMSWTARA
jgi:uncharacterized membrane protein